MGQLEELKLFVSERLHAVASEIAGAIEKAITNYEDQASRLKEENERNRSLLDIILKSKIPQIEVVKHNENPPSTAVPCASDSSPTHEIRETTIDSSDLQFVFTSRTDFLKFATSIANGSCPYCVKTVQATEGHLMKRHYLKAIHFIEDGTENFVVPCVCKDRIQDSGRSHWHCPLCRKIIFRTANFEQHLSKQHQLPILQECQGAGCDHRHVSSLEEAPMSPETFYQQQLGNVGGASQQTSLLLEIKGEEEQEMWNQVSHLESQNSEQLQIKGDHIPEGNGQMGQQIAEADHTQYPTSNICVVSYIEYPGQINSAETSLENPLDIQPGICGISLQPGEEHHTADHKTEWSNHSSSPMKAVISKRKQLVNRSVPFMGLNKKSKKSSARQNPTGPHCCKVCGKTFHYMYTLKTHAEAHAVDKIHLCGICGRDLESSEKLVCHLQRHNKRNKCSVCGKQFSNNARLKRHKRFHRPKGLSVKTTD